MVKRRREVYSIRWRKDAKLWVCVNTNEYDKKKSKVVYRISHQLRRRWKFGHVPCQLRVFGKNGRIQYERTYGHDPRRYRS